MLNPSFCLSKKTRYYLPLFKSDFLRGQFHSRHFLSFKLTPNRRKFSGLVVSPSCVLPLTEENVEKVLDEVRPGLMADGGNVVLHEIDGLVVVLKLEGACGSCPSSTMTLKMGIETRLRDKIPEIMAVEQIMDTETGLELNEENVEKIYGTPTEELKLVTFRFFLRLDHTSLGQEVEYLNLFKLMIMLSRFGLVVLRPG
ncbi:nifU-like protein 3, chloroplastic isoform X2 [Jatropha curcas]|uniref:nifU-like protein 3, chloroplastic isoform X2 n=1 Tax=Jatropha curcas TaxID=180498 RepID=UPI0005FBB04B|nr:nifU-like protein 3, chloroplastic isoform X2 [Jatropha curcas]